MKNSAEPEEVPRKNGNDGFDELRRLLLAPEQKQIDQLEERLESATIQADQISDVLPDAIRIRQSRDKQLTQSLMPSIQEAIRDSIKKDPRVLADALFPIMGPAIRKAIAAALSGMIQSLNKTLEYSLSPRGLKWRWEALRTGKSFAEIVLIHTLLYRVEQVFLIHKSTGLLLRHITASSVPAQDANLVSGMLTAIQDFVHDSFGDREDTLETLQVGDLSVWIEQGPHAVLAAVIRGNAPEELRMILREVVENIHQEKLEELETFEGDAAPFESVRPLLEDCLLAQYEVKEKRTSPLLYVFVGILALVIGAWSFLWIRDRMNWNRYLGMLREEPGIVIVDSRKEDGKYFVSGFRDPLASDPRQILKTTDLDPGNVVQSWEPFHSFSPRFILKRAKEILNPPPSVTLKVDQNTLIASGFASQKWINDAESLVRAVPTVEQFRHENLVVADLAELERMKAKIEKNLLLFPQGASQLIPGQEERLEELANDLNHLAEICSLIGKNLQLRIVGHASQEGSREENLVLSQKRSQQLISELSSRGITRIDLSAVGTGTEKPVRPEVTPEDRQSNRSVSFEVRWKP